MRLLDQIRIPGWEKIAGARAGAPLAVSGATQALAAAAGAGLAAEGKRVLLVAEHDLKAARLADDVRQWTGEDCPFLPGGEIDLTRAAGSLESSWRRLEALTAAAEGARMMVTSAEALMQRMGRPEPFRQACFTLKPGDRVSPASLVSRLSRMGYERVNMVEGKGQFALRGAILDFYPPAGKEGIRIEFFDDEVDSLRTFDCISQRSQERLQEIRVTPASEVLMTPEKGPAAAERMRAALERMEAAPKKETLLMADLPPLPEDEDEEAFFDEKIAPKARENAYRERENSEIERRRSRLTADADLVEAGQPFRRMRSWVTVLEEDAADLTDWFRPDAVILWEPDRIRTRTEERIQGFAEDLGNAMARGEAVQEQESLLRPWEETRIKLEELPLTVMTEMLQGLGGIRPGDSMDLGAAGLVGYQGQIRLLRNDMVSWREKGYRILLLSGGEARGRRPGIPDAGGEAGPGQRRGHLGRRIPEEQK